MTGKLLGRHTGRILSKLIVFPLICALVLFFSPFAAQASPNHVFFITKDDCSVIGQYENTPADIERMCVKLGELFLQGKQDLSRKRECSA